MRGCKSTQVMFSEVDVDEINFNLRIKYGYIRVRRNNPFLAVHE